MDIHGYRNIVVKAITIEVPMGTILKEDVDLDFIETQLMKMGSLSHEEIEWHKVEKIALNILGKKSKDIKVLSYLIQCLQYQPTPQRFILSLSILSDFINCFWENCYPFSGAKGNIARQRLLTQIMQRSTKLLDQIDPTIFEPSDKDSFEDVINELTSSYSMHNILPNDIEKFSNHLKQILAPSKIAPLEISSSNLSHVAPSDHTNVTIDTSDNRALKKTLIQISKLLIDLNQPDFSLQIKRLALWNGIYTAPPHKTNGETELASIPADKVAEYQSQLDILDMLDKNQNDEIWHKIEQSILLSPFWIDGHYFSYLFAKNSGDIKLATTIQQCAHDFITRLPILKTLSFKGGVPFMSEKTSLWLETNGIQEKTLTTNSNSQVKDKQAQAQIILETLGLKEALFFLNTGIEEANSIREEVYWKLAMAEVYESQNLHSLSRDIYQNIHPIIANMLVSDWESNLNNHVCNKLK